MKTLYKLLLLLLAAASITFGAARAFAYSLNGTMYKTPFGERYGYAVVQGLIDSGRMFKACKVGKNDLGTIVDQAAAPNWRRGDPNIDPNAPRNNNADQYKTIDYSGWQWDFTCGAGLKLMKAATFKVDEQTVMDCGESCNKLEYKNGKYWEVIEFKWELNGEGYKLMRLVEYSEDYDEGIIVERNIYRGISRDYALDEWKRDVGIISGDEFDRLYPGCENGDISGCRLKEYAWTIANNDYESLKRYEIDGWMPVINKVIDITEDQELSVPITIVNRYYFRYLYDLKINGNGHNVAFSGASGGKAWIYNDGPNTIWVDNIRFTGNGPIIGSFVRPLTVTNSEFRVNGTALKPVGLWTIVGNKFIETGAGGDGPAAIELGKEGAFGRYDADGKYSISSVFYPDMVYSWKEKNGLTLEFPQLLLGDEYWRRAWDDTKNARKACRGEAENGYNTFSSYHFEKDCERVLYEAALQRFGGADNKLKVVDSVEGEVIGFSLAGLFANGYNTIANNQFDSKKAISIGASSRGNSIQGNLYKADSLSGMIGTENVSKPRHIRFGGAGGVEYDSIVTGLPPISFGSANRSYRRIRLEIDGESPELIEIFKLNNENVYEPRIKVCGYNGGYLSGLHCDAAFYIIKSSGESGEDAEYYGFGDNDIYGYGEAEDTVRVDAFIPTDMITNGDYFVQTHREKRSTFGSYVWADWLGDSSVFIPLHLETEKDEYRIEAARQTDSMRNGAYEDLKARLTGLGVYDIFDGYCRDYVLPQKEENCELNCKVRTYSTNEQIVKMIGTNWNECAEKLCRKEGAGYEMAFEGCMINNGCSYLMANGYGDCTGLENAGLFMQEDVLIGGKSKEQLWTEIVQTNHDMCVTSMCGSGNSSCEGRYYNRENYGFPRDDVMYCIKSNSCNAWDAQVLYSDYGGTVCKEWDEGSGECKVKGKTPDTKPLFYDWRDRKVHNIEEECRSVAQQNLECLRDGSVAAGWKIEGDECVRVTCEGEFDYIDGSGCKRCPLGQTPTEDKLGCRPIECSEGKILRGNSCVEPEPDPEPEDPIDVPVQCADGFVEANGECMPEADGCSEGMVESDGGRCVAPSIECEDGMVLDDGICRPDVIVDCVDGYALLDGACVENVLNSSVGKKGGCSLSPDGKFDSDLLLLYAFISIIVGVLRKKAAVPQ